MCSSRLAAQRNPAVFTTLFEVKLLCSGTSVFSGASLLEHLPNATDDTLLLTVRIHAVTSDGTSKVCAYCISDINALMDNGVVACATGEDGATVWDHRFPVHLAKICMLPSTNVC